MLASRTIWGTVLAVIGWLTSPEVLAVLPEKIAAVLMGVGAILGAIGLRAAIDKAGTKEITQ
jgi:hypothetical protein